jgi:hypothetical protein
LLRCIVPQISQKNAGALIARAIGDIGANLQYEIFTADITLAVINQLGLFTFNDPFITKIHFV